MTHITRRPSVRLRADHPRTLPQAQLLHKLPTLLFVERTQRSLLQALRRPRAHSIGQAKAEERQIGARLEGLIAVQRNDGDIVRRLDGRLQP
ncbi:hypothetical protein TYRP_017055 [Tyrophagus putrescentiae]|nr:hypothetical protein TYRP_017055 [Tyrophagus putrescentiae]